MDNEIKYLSDGELRERRHRLGNRIMPMMLRLDELDEEIRRREHERDLKTFGAGSMASGALRR